MVGPHNGDGAYRQNLIKVIYVGLCFMMLFTAYQSAQNLVSQIYEQLQYTGLGGICIFSIYGALGIGNIFAPHVKRQMNHKAGMLIGSFFYTLFIAIGTLATYCHKYLSDGFYCQKSSIYGLNVLSSILLGLSGSCLWLSQGDYVNCCANEKTKGFFNGVFWSIMQVCQIIGSVVATFVLGNTDQFTFYKMLLCFGCLACVMFVFLPSVQEQDSQTEKKQESLSESVSKFFYTLRLKSSYFIFACFFLAGIVVALYVAFLPSIMKRIFPTEDDQYVNLRSGYVLVALACGEVMAGIVMGKLADIYNKIQLVNTIIMIGEAALILTFVAYIYKIYALTVLSWFIWGFTDNSFQTIMTSLIGSHFKGKLEYFAIFRFLQGLGVVFGSVVTIVIPEALTCVVVIAATLLFLHVQFYLTKPKDSAEEEKLLSTNELSLAFKKGAKSLATPSGEIEMF